jgi:hypothetical protein
MAGPLGMTAGRGFTEPARAVGSGRRDRAATRRPAKQALADGYGPLAQLVRAAQGPLTVVTCKKGAPSPNSCGKIPL